jgi:hypothetical protein
MQIFLSRMQIPQYRMHISLYLMMKFISHADILVSNVQPRFSKDNTQVSNVNARIQNDDVLISNFDIQVSNANTLISNVDALFFIVML